MESLHSNENISASRVSTFIKHNQSQNRNTITTTAQQHQLPISVAPPPAPPPPPLPITPVTPTPTRPSSRSNTMCKEHFSAIIPTFFIWLIIIEWLVNGECFLLIFSEFRRLILILWVFSKYYMVDGTLDRMRMIEKSILNVSLPSHCRIKFLIFSSIYFCPN